MCYVVRLSKVLLFTAVKVVCVSCVSSCIARFHYMDYRYISMQLYCHLLYLSYFIIPFSWAIYIETNLSFKTYKLICC